MQKHLDTLALNAAEQERPSTIELVVDARRIERLQKALVNNSHRIKNHPQTLVALAEAEVLSGGGDTVPVTTLQGVSQQIRALATLHDLLIGAL